MPQVTKPDAAFGGELAQVGPAVGGENKRNSVLRLITPVAFMELRLSAGGKRAAVALGLLQCAGYIDVFALGLHDSHGGEALKQHVVGRVTIARPFSNGHVAAPLRACALAVAQGEGVLLAGFVDAFGHAAREMRVGGGDAQAVGRVLDGDDALEAGWG